MLAALILALAPILFIGIAAACVRRALPLAAAALAGWFAFAWSNEFATAAWIALTALGLSAYAMDRLATWEATRQLTITVEIMCGLGLAGGTAFAVFYSSGVRDMALVAAIATTIVLALGVMARFRFDSPHQE